VKNFEFPCGDVSLDFLGTRQRRQDAEPTEFFTSPERVGAWFREAGLSDDDVAFENLDDAVALREAVYSLTRSRLDSAAYDTAALELVNATAARTPITTVLTASGRRIEAGPSQALATIARDAVGILTREDGMLKQCGNEGCTQIYVDHSRGGRREWCSMEPCGNRIKARAYRARKAASAA
jgi:predicted RNA-binding Zn ribbon-like protein